MCFNQNGATISLKGKPLKLVGQFTYHGGNISSTGSDVNIHIGKSCTTIERLTTIWKSDHCNEIKFLSCCPVSEMLREKARCELHKCLEQIREEATYKKTTSSMTTYIS